MYWNFFGPEPCYFNTHKHSLPLAEKNRSFVLERTKHVNNIFHLFWNSSLIKVGKIRTLHQGWHEGMRHPVQRWARQPRDWALPSVQKCAAIHAHCIFESSSPDSRQKAPKAQCTSTTIALVNCAFQAYRQASQVGARLNRTGVTWWEEGWWATCPSLRAAVGPIAYARSSHAPPLKQLGKHCLSAVAYQLYIMRCFMP